MCRLSALLALALSAALVAPAPSAADTVIELPFLDASGLVVDPVRDRVSVADPRHGRVHVFTLSGDPVGVVDGLEELETIYGSGSSEVTAVMRDGEHTVARLAVIDPVDVTAEHLDLGPVCAASAATLGDHTWYFDDCDQRVHLVERTSGATKVVADADWWTRLAATPVNPAHVFVASAGPDTEPMLRRFDATTGALQATSPLPSYSGGAVEVSDDGSQVLVDTGGGEVVAFDATSLDVLLTYTSAGVELAMSSSGVLAAVNGDISFFPPGSPERMNRYDLQHAAFAGFVGDVLYFVHHGYNRTTLRTQVPRYGARLEVRAPRRAEYRRVHVSIRLATASANRTVGLYFNPGGAAPEQLVRSVEVPPGERVEVRVPMEWNGQVVARYAGDEVTEAASATSDWIRVRGRVTNRAVRYVREVGGVHLVRTGVGASIVGRVLPVQPGLKVAVQYQFRVDGTWQSGRNVDLRLADDGWVGLRLLGRESLRGYTMRMRIVAPMTRRVLNGVGEWVSYRWIR